jgi:hypothetical protein
MFVAPVIVMPVLEPTADPFSPIAKIRAESPESL